MLCYFQKTGAVKNVPIEKISLTVGVGIHGRDFLRNTEKNQDESRMSGGRKKLMELFIWKVFVLIY